MAFFRRGRSGSPEATAESAENPESDAVDPPSSTDSAVGPFDRGERTLAPDQIDLGALWLVGVPGMQLRLDVDQESGDVTAASLLDRDSLMQIQVFAAPKSTGIWSDVRTEILDGVAAQGGSGEEVPGPWGVELLARLPSRGPNGQQQFNPARFIGVDGPRWFLRAVITGPAASEQAAAERFLDVLRGCVVDRGSHAMAPREVLALSLPGQDEAVPQRPDPGDEEDFTPFERGPEITEIR